jgi:hypothetical protein
MDFQPPSHQLSSTMFRMKMTATHFVFVAFVLAAPFLFNGCMTQEARTNRVERRQDRMDNRFEGRMERRRVRSEREDARYDRWWDATMN